eukprot:602248-Hanusia_phi.AAC.1
MAHCYGGGVGVGFAMGQGGRGPYQGSYLRAVEGGNVQKCQSEGWGGGVGRRCSRLKRIVLDVQVVGGQY